MSARSDLAEMVSADVLEELDRAYRKFARMQVGPHEGYAVLLEEVDELWDAIKGNAPWAEQRAEAVQVAAMALRFIVDGEIRRDHAE